MSEPASRARIEGVPDLEQPLVVMCAGGVRSLFAAQAHPDVHVTSIVPEIFPGIEGLKPLGHPGDLVPEILDESVIDRRIEVTIDDAVALCRRLALQGLFVGPSSGAYVHAALAVASAGRYRTIVTILNDTGERYGSTGMWERSATG